MKAEQAVRILDHTLEGIFEAFIDEIRAADYPTLNALSQEIVETLYDNPNLAVLTRENASPDEMQQIFELMGNIVRFTDLAETVPAKGFGDLITGAFDTFFTTINNFVVNN